MSWYVILHMWYNVSGKISVICILGFHHSFTSFFLNMHQVVRLGAFFCLWGGCTKANALFRSRAGLDCRIIRTGGSKCCEWCDGVSGSFTTGNAPDGIWGRHDNCKCSITYETRRGSFQQLSGTGNGWNTVKEPRFHKKSRAVSAAVQKSFILFNPGRSLSPRCFPGIHRSFRRVWP